jgi:hypothetical protein
MAVAERCRMTLRAVLRSTTARSGADSTVTGGRRRPSASTFLRIVPIRRHTVAPPLGQQGRVLVFNGTRPFSSDLQRRRFVRSTPIMTRRNTMPTTTVTTPSASDILFHRAGSVTSTEPVKHKPEASRMVRLTVNLPSHLVEQMRDAVYWTPGLTLAWLVARAVRASLTELETIHQGPFAKRTKPLRAGRPRLLGQSMKVQPHVGGDSVGSSPQDACQHQAVSLRPVP